MSATELTRGKGQFDKYTYPAGLYVWKKTENVWGACGRIRTCGVVQVPGWQQPLRSALRVDVCEARPHSLAGLSPLGSPQLTASTKGIVLLPIDNADRAPLFSRFIRSVNCQSLAERWKNPAMLAFKPAGS